MRSLKTKEATKRLPLAALLIGCLALAVPVTAIYDLQLFQEAVVAMLEFDPTLDPPPDNPGRDFVVGGAQFIGGLANVGVSAHGGPDGEDPKGHVSDTAPFPMDPTKPDQIRISVTCLAVSGNLAAVGGIVTESSSNDFPPGTNIVYLFRDSMIPGGQGDGMQSFLAQADGCHDPFFMAAAAGAPPINHGNILIHDAVAP
jgi:hypothetical protein